MCGYHGWAYGLDGGLEYARDAQADPSLLTEELFLIRVSVDQWAQAVFVNPDANAVSLSETHRQLDPLAREGGFNLAPDDYTLRREIVTDIKAN